MTSGTASCVKTGRRLSGCKLGVDKDPSPTLIGPSPPCCLLIQEFEVIAQIKLLQSACNNYSIAPEEHFGAWFRAMERLSEAER